MRYWWVNQNQTFQAERDGGYLWSPKRNRDGHRNHFYETMREVSPGDLIFSFRDTLIPSLSVARSYSCDSPKPAEFGSVGDQWDRDGWRVDAAYATMTRPIKPKDHMAVLGPLLPDKYAPLQPNGNGLQAVYLAEIPQAMADKLLELLKAAGNTLPTIGRPAPPPPTPGGDAATAREDEIERAIGGDTTIPETERKALVSSRRGQGLFRERVQTVEKQCRLTGVADQAFLIAGHIKPWRASSNRERLDGENGLLLTPTVDSLFDRGFIGFADNGDLIISPVLHGGTAAKLGLPPTAPFNVGAFTPGQRVYLEYHRAFILKRAQ